MREKIVRDQSSAHNQFSVQRNPQSRQKPRKWEKLRDFYSHFFLDAIDFIFTFSQLHYPRFNVSVNDFRRFVPDSSNNS